MSNAVSEMFINAAIIISFLTFGNYFMRDKGINPASPMIRKFIAGISAGVSGCLLMIYSVHFTPEIFVDFRYIPIIIMAFYASFESSFIAALIIGIFRIGYFGFSKSSVTAFLVVIIIAAGCGLISRLKVKRRVKWVVAVLTTNVTASTAFIILLLNSEMLGKILVFFIVITSLASFAMYFLAEYIEYTNHFYRQMKDDIKRDYLTGLNNVRQFDTLLNISINSAKERNEKLSMLYIDLDFFKKVNDTYGHPEGDLVLKEIGEILKKTCRSFDIISRNGGEEFSVILLDCPLERAVEVAERIRSKVEKHDFVLSSGQKINITISIGVSSFPETTADIEKLVEHADIALYSAKRTGRNTVSIKL